MIKKLAVLVSVVVMFCSSCRVFAATNCSDWAKEIVMVAEDCGIVSDEIDWDYKTAMSRGELAPILLRAYENVTGREKPEADTRYFSDASSEADALYLLGVMNGVGEGRFAPDEPITREQISKIILTLKAVCEDEELVLPQAYYNPLTDFMAVSDWAKPYVEQAYNKGIITGYEDGSFQGQKTVSREEAVALLVRCLEFQEVLPEQEAIAKEELFLDAEGFQWNLKPGLKAGEFTVLWSRLSKGTEYNFTVIEQRNSRYEGDIPPNTPMEFHYTDQYSHTMYLYPNRTYQFILTAGGKSLDAKIYIPKIHTEKMDLIEENLPETKEEADQLMTEVTVPVWKMRGDGGKYDSTMTVKVHYMIADEVLAVFTEIFHAEEQFPVKDLGGYSWRGGRSEHNWGTAIDLNANENYCLYQDGTAIGDGWFPYENPYSVTPYGEVVNIFEKYGFTWGGDAWSNPKDYMHFSYLGT